MQVLLKLIFPLQGYLINSLNNQNLIKIDYLSYVLLFVNLNFKIQFSNFQDNFLTLLQYML